VVSVQPPVVGEIEIVYEADLRADEVF